MRVVFGPQSRRAFVCSTMRQRERIGPVDRSAAGREKGRHLAVAGSMRLAVEGRADQE
jgi:hypothetical protein